jgi:hypothetical protein
MQKSESKSERSIQIAGEEQRKSVEILVQKPRQREPVEQGGAEAARHQVRPNGLERAASTAARRPGVVPGDDGGGLVSASA